MTLKELSEHPERASEEEFKSLEECFHLVKEMSPVAEDVPFVVRCVGLKIRHIFYYQDL